MPIMQNATIGRFRNLHTIQHNIMISLVEEEVVNKCINLKHVSIFIKIMTNLAQN